MAFKDKAKILLSYIREDKQDTFKSMVENLTYQEKLLITEHRFEDLSTLLMAASCRGRKAIVDFLLTNSYCYVNFKTAAGWTALMFASHAGHIDILKLLLDYGAEINAKNSLGSTALHLATDKDRVEVVKELLDQNASTDIKDNAGYTVLNRAKYRENQVIVDLLEKEKSPGIILKDKLVQCIRKGNLDNFDRILKEENKNNNVYLNSPFDDECTWLMCAAFHGHIEIVEYLLEKKCDVNRRSSADWTPLMFAAHAGQEDVVERLLKEGATVNAVNKKGSTALHLATDYGYLNIVKQLLVYKAKTDIKDKSQFTAFLIAKYRGYHGIANLLKTETEADCDFSEQKAIELCQAGEVTNDIFIRERQSLQTKPTFPYSESTRYTWAFSAFAELIDSACNPDVRDSRLLIDMVDINDTPCLVFQDNGAGMNYEKLHTMLSISGLCKTYSYETSGAYNSVKLYGDGFKSSCMRLGKDALVFTRCRDSASVGFLSQTFLEHSGADCVSVPMVKYTLPNLNRSDSLDTNLKAILEYSIYKDEDTLLNELKSLESSITGTKIIIYNLRLQDGSLELDFVSDLKDIRCHEADKKDTDFLGNRPTAAQASNYKTSLREYCKILFLRPRLKIILRGEIVKSTLVAKSLHKTEKIAYRPHWLVKPVNITLGFSCGKKETEDYGVMIYRKNRLIKAYERVGIQLKSKRKGVGVVVVTEADFLKPTQDKQDFIPDENFKSLIKALGKNLNDYWNEKMKGDGLPQTLKTERNPDCLWVQCDRCRKWRNQPPGTLQEELPDKWFCRMNRDATHNRCNVPEENLDDEEFCRNRCKISKIKKKQSKAKKRNVVSLVFQLKSKQVSQKDVKRRSKIKKIAKETLTIKRASNTNLKDDEHIPCKRTKWSPDTKLVISPLFNKKVQTSTTSEHSGTEICDTTSGAECSWKA